MRRHAFRAMGTTVSVLLDDGAADATIAGVEGIFEREERRCSRFRADSELSRVNAGAGSWTRVSPALAQLVRLALREAALSDGCFDPAALAAVTAAGYDRDFDALLAGARDALRPPVPCGRWREIELRGDSVRIPLGVGLDLGGLAKGWTADLAAEAAVATGEPWIVVNAGGDLRIAGDAPPVEVAIEDPADTDAALARLSLRSGAIATSSTLRRSWGAGRHHLIDPRTGAPADTGVVQATVWAPTCAGAEVAAKRALLDASPGSAPAVLVRENGDVLTNIASLEVAA